jgi:hypothetical protein
MAIYFDEPFANALTYPMDGDMWWDSDVPPYTITDYPKAMYLWNVEVAAGRLSALYHVGEYGGGAMDSGAMFGIMDDWRSDAYTPNAERDVLFAEVDLLFTEPDFTECIDNWSGQIFALWPTMASYPSIALELVIGYSFDEDLWDWVETPGTHCLHLAWMNRTMEWGTPGADIFVHYTTAQLFTGVPITYRIEWQAATFTKVLPYTFQQDGYMRLLVNGAEVGRVDNIDLSPNMYCWPEDNIWFHQLYAVGIYTGMLGSYDNLRVGTVVADWVDVANFVEVEMPKRAFPGGHCRCPVYLWTDTPGATIQARLRNVTDNTTVGTSPIVTATTPTYAGFFVVLEGNDTTSPGTSTPPTRAYQFWRFADDGTDNLTNGETCTLGTKTYTFVDTLTNVPGYVKIQSTLVDTLFALARAVMREAGTAGIDYAASTVANELAGAFVSRIKGQRAPDGGIYLDTHLKAYALAAGEAGNTIACLSSRVEPTYYGWVGEGNVQHDHLYEGHDASSTPPVTDIDTKYYRLQVTTNTPEAALFAIGPGLVL